MGRFHISGFDRTVIGPVIQLFSGSAIVIRDADDEKIPEEDQCTSLRFNSAVFGKVLLQMIPKERMAQVFIACDRQEPPSEDRSHIIVLSDVQKTYHHRNDSNGHISVIFENKHGDHLQITEYGEVFMGKILTFKELGDAFPDTSQECKLPEA